MLMCMYVCACFMGLINTPHMNCTPAGERDSKPRLLNHEFLVWFHWCNVLAQRIGQLNIQLVHIKSNYNSCVVSKSSDIHTLCLKLEPVWRYWLQSEWWLWINCGDVSHHVDLPKYIWSNYNISPTQISLTTPPFGVRSCEVAIIWPGILNNNPLYLSALQIALQIHPVHRVLL